MKRRLILLAGKKDTIKGFKVGFLPKTNSFRNSSHTVLDLKNTDMNSMENINSIINAISFITEENETNDITDIFLFIHTIDVDNIERIVTLFLKQFKPVFESIKFVYLVNDQDEMDVEDYDKLINFKENLDVDLDITDLFSDELESDNIELLRDRVYLLGDIAEISLIFNEGVVPERIKDGIEMYYLKVIDSIIKSDS